MITWRTWAVSLASRSVAWVAWSSWSRYVRAMAGRRAAPPRINPDCSATARRVLKDQSEIFPPAASSDGKPAAARADRPLNSRASVIMDSRIPLGDAEGVVVGSLVEGYAAVDVGLL